jgi:hypothetical protein
MNIKNEPPWTSGSGEILKHALELLKEDSDIKRRLAMISVDNSVELMMKTYLGLPKRVTGLTITRREYQEFSESFPKLLDALETYASDKLDGIDLGEIEWYHRLRNQLYHQGNGLTVERDKVEVYSELANLLFEKLFGFRLTKPATQETELLGLFLSLWIEIEKSISKLAIQHSTDKKPLVLLQSLALLFEKKNISSNDFKEFQRLRQIRNSLIHGEETAKPLLTSEVILDLKHLKKAIDTQTSKTT